MLTIWDYSSHKEVFRLLHTAHQIANGFYKINGFIVLPFPFAQPNGRIVPFPDLPYLSIPRFWDRVAKMDRDKLFSENPDIDPILISQTETLLAQANLPTPKFDLIKSTWIKAEAEIMDSIYSTMPRKKKSISKIHIWPTVFGTGASFNILNNYPGEIFIWLRQDKGISAIVESIITTLTRNDVYDSLSGVWQESEIIVDWLVSYSPINAILAKVDPNWKSSLTIKNTRAKQDGTFAETSQQFLKKIGAPQINPTEINLTNFSPREKEIMQLLISSAPQPVSTDQIGDILFKDNPDDYSLFAISKTIQRLRDKLEKGGISGSFIQTKRGEGYLLAN